MTTPPRPAWLTLPVALGALALCTFSLLAWICRAPGILTTQDDARYLLLARDLASGHYRDLWTVGTPPHGQYPPGFPLWLALLRPLVGERFPWLIGANIAAVTAALGLTAWAASRRLGVWPALAALWVAALQPLLIRRAGMLVAEAPFLLWVSGFVAALATEQPSRRRLVLAGCCALAAALTRSAGVPLVAALLVLLALERRWKAAALFATAAAVVLGGWFLYVAGLPQLVGESYLADARVLAVGGAGGNDPGVIGALWDRFWRNVTRYAGQSLPLALALPSFSGTLLDNVANTLVALGATLTGFVVAWRRWRAASLAVAATMALLLAWTWASTRFLIPLIPLLLALALAGMHRIGGVRATLALTAVMLSTAAVRTSTLIGERAGCDRSGPLPAGSCVREDEASLLAAIPALRALPDDAILVTSKPEPVYLYTGRRSLSYRALLQVQRDSIPSVMIARGATHLLLSSLQESEVSRLGPAMRAACDRLLVVAAYPPRTWLFRVRSAADTTGGDGCAAYEQWRRRTMGRSSLAPDE